MGHMGAYASHSWETKDTMSHSARSIHNHAATDLAPLRDRLRGQSGELWHSENQRGLSNDEWGSMSDVPSWGCHSLPPRPPGTQAFRAGAILHPGRTPPLLQTTVVEYSYVLPPSLC